MAQFLSKRLFFRWQIRNQALNRLKLLDKTLSPEFYQPSQELRARRSSRRRLNNSLLWAASTADQMMHKIQTATKFPSTNPPPQSVLPRVTATSPWLLRLLAVILRLRPCLLFNGPKAYCRRRIWTKVVSRRQTWTSAVSLNQPPRSLLWNPTQNVCPRWKRREFLPSPLLLLLLKVTLFYYYIVFITFGMIFKT